MRSLRVIPALSVLFACIPVVAVSPPDELRPSFVFVNAFLLQSPVVQRLPGEPALLVLWPDGVLQHVDCSVGRNPFANSVTIRLYGGYAVRTGRWKKIGHSMQVSIPRFKDASMIETSLDIEGKAQGRIAARLRSMNVVFAAAPGFDNLRILQPVLEKAKVK